MENLNSQKPELTKEEKFKANPDRYICLDDLVIALMRSEQGLMMFCVPHSRKEAIQAKGECDAVLSKLILEMDLQSEIERKGGIIPAKGGILNAARNRLFRK